MADDPTPRPDADVIGLLNAAYVPILTLFEAAHVHEHIFEQCWGYLGLRDLFDGLVADARCWRREILNRIIRLGGDVDSRIEPVQTSDDVGKAYSLTLDALRGIFDALAAGHKGCEAANDYVSGHLCKSLMVAVDARVAELERLIRQAGDMSASDYIATLIVSYRDRSGRPADDANS